VGSSAAILSGPSGRGPRRSLTPTLNDVARQPRQTIGSLTYEHWSAALLDVLLPVLPPERTGQVVLLACDDGVVRDAAHALGFDGDDPAAEFGRLVEAKFRIARDGSPDTIRRPTTLFFREREPDAIAPFFGACCAFVLAASRMTTDADAHAVNYYDRLWDVLGRRPSTLPPYDFGYLPHLFERLAEWLAGEVAGARGHLYIPEGGRPHVGYPINQCLFRERDKDHLAAFFADRVGRRRGELDLLRLLQVSSDRHDLTHRARRAIATPELADLARAALTHAFETWDGTRPDPRGGRSWPATLHLSINRGFRLTISAPEAPAGLALGGGRVLSNPAFDRVRLDNDEFAELTTRGLRFGPAPAGIYLPAAGDTLVFEVREDSGLVWVTAPGADHVFVLTSEAGLQRRLAAYTARLPSFGELPRGWNLYERVPTGQLPTDVADIRIKRPPVALVGGLRIGQRRYLTGHAPRIEVGDVDEPLTVSFNGTRVAEVAAGQDLQLELTPGEHAVDAGGLVRWTVHMLDTNPARPKWGQLAYPLTDQGARGGATASCEDACVHGALLSDAYEGEIPLMLRGARAAVLIDAGGHSTTLRAPDLPTWLQHIGLDPDGVRWEAELGPDTVWAITAQQAIAIRPLALARLDEGARAAVETLSQRGEPCVRSLRRRDREAAQAAFDEMATSPPPKAEA